MPISSCGKEWKVWGSVQGVSVHDTPAGCVGVCGGALCGVSVRVGIFLSLHASNPVNALAEDSWLIIEKNKAKSGNHSPKLHCSIVCEPNRSTAQERGGREKERRTIKLQVGDTWDAKPGPHLSGKRCSETISLGAVRVFQAVFQQWLFVNLTHVPWILYLIQDSTSP